MAAKKKEIAVPALSEIEVEADEVGAENAGSEVISSTPKPAKQAGERVVDEGDGGTRSSNSWSRRRSSSSSRPAIQPDQLHDIHSRR